MKSSIQGSFLYKIVYIYIFTTQTNLMAIGFFDGLSTLISQKEKMMTKLICWSFWENF